MVAAWRQEGFAMGARSCGLALPCTCVTGWGSGERAVLRTCRNTIRASAQRGPAGLLLRHAASAMSKP